MQNRNTAYNYNFLQFPKYALAAEILRRSCDVKPATDNMQLHLQRDESKKREKEREKSDTIKKRVELLGEFSEGTL